MRTGWPALKLWMELACKQKWMINALNNFDKVIVRVNTTRSNTPLSILVTIRIIALASVAMSFDNA
jgi:hypothetical protein